MNYHVRDLYAMSEEALMALPTAYSITFDDGEVKEVWRLETVYSWLFWKIFDGYQNVKMLYKHHASSVMKGKPANSGTHRKLCSAILESIVRSEGLWLPVQKEPLLERIYRVISDASNRLSILTARDVTSIDITDFVQIAHDPRVSKLRDEAEEDPRKIKYAFENTIDIIETAPEFDENGLAKAVRSGMVKNNQVLQCVQFLGYRTEVDGEILQKPVFTNYTFGNRDLYTMVSDSRTAAKAHYYADSPLKDAEYTARKFRLVTMSLERIRHDDCGSTDYVHWMVKGPTMDDSGTVTYPGDLPFMIGKYYLDEKTGQLNVIEGNEKHLVGKVIKMRSVLKCKLHDPHEVCHICAGALTENISRFSNIGHLGSVTTTKVITQTVLSIKHVNTSSVALKILLDDYQRKFLNSGPTGTAFYLNDGLAKMGVKLTFNKDEIPGLIDLVNAEDIDALTLPRVSQTTMMRVTINDGGAIHEPVIEVTQKTKPSMLSREMLRHIKDNGWEVDAHNDFVFDMASWDFQDPILVMPNKEESYPDLSNHVAVTVLSSQKNLKKRHAPNAPEILLQEVFDLVNTKLNVNILSFEVIVYGFMVKSISDYSLGRNAAEPVLGVGEILTKYRSLGPAMTYEDQHLTLKQPISFFKGKRPDSPLDVFLCPREVVEDYKRRQLI